MFLSKSIFAVFKGFVAFVAKVKELIDTSYHCQEAIRPFITFPCLSCAHVTDTKSVAAFAKGGTSNEDRELKNILQKLR